MVRAATSGAIDFAHFDPRSRNWWKRLRLVLQDLHNEDLIAAVQREAAFEPGELVVVWVESQAWGSHVQHYTVIDAALGVIERGTWRVTDAVAEQPWLPNGPIPTEVTWSLMSRKPSVARDKEDRDHGALA